MLSDFLLFLIKIEISFPLKSLLLTSIPNEKNPANFFAVIIGNKEKGKLSTASYPRSSKIFKAVDLPAPERPVTIISLFFSSTKSLVKFQFDFCNCRNFIWFKFQMWKI